ncbi:MAG: hypothetical protein KBD21_04165 [Candidatus Pacebacteria bacterium]|nr:hypothetical protein [Candidatus Paceibacterota bacterium]
MVEDDKHLLTLIKYVERNPIRAKLTTRCEHWQWESAWRHIHGSVQQQKLLDIPPTPFPYSYIEWINASDNGDDMVTIRQSVNKGVPYGRERCVDAMVSKHHLETTLRAPGRPRKN